MASLMVVCANPKLIKESTADLQGTWGTPKNRDKVGKAFVKAVKEAEEKGNVQFPETLKLFKYLFPWVLK